ncbi:MAG: tripartite tricarboxylate transporter TctB family protein [Lentilitoribacter sp.]
MTNAQLDKITGLIFVVLGAAVILGAWHMPRFEAQNAHIYQTPGLTPAILGAGLAICGFILIIRPARGNGSNRDYWMAILGSPKNRIRALSAIILTLGYGGGLFGKVPFILATFLFIFAFIVTFELFLRSNSHEQPNKVRVVLIAGLIAIITSVGCQYIFENLFLIRLP